MVGSHFEASSDAEAMPSINVVRDHLYEALGRQFTEDEFNDLCFEFGIELDKVYEELREVRCGAASCAIAAGSEG